MISLALQVERDVKLFETRGLEMFGSFVLHLM